MIKKNQGGYAKSYAFQKVFGVGSKDDLEKSRFDLVILFDGVYNCGKSMDCVESVQRNFFAQVSGKGVDDLNYWDKLSEFKISAQERRRDRYMPIFLWKISQGLVKGYSVEFTSDKGRRGRVALPHSVVQSSLAMVRRARECTLGVKGTKMFNLLPPSIRNINSSNVDVFKQSLDEFLSRVPDQPTAAGEQQLRVIVCCTRFLYFC